MRLSFAGLTSVTSLVIGVFLLAVPSAQTDRAVDVSRSHFDANRRAYGLANAASELRVRAGPTVAVTRMFVTTRCIAAFQCSRVKPSLTSRRTTP